MNMRAVTLTCPGGLEALLAAEMSGWGMQVGHRGRGAVTGMSEPAGLYRACLWSRYANHVLLRIAGWPGGGDADDLYEQLGKVDWDHWLSPGQRFLIAVSGRSGAIANTQHAVFRAKDAIVDHFVSRARIRPQVDRERPEITFQLHLDDVESVIYLNLNGAPLHERGYRVAGVAAPVKENLAAALAAWSGVGQGGAGQGGAGKGGVGKSGAVPSVVLDPMCGSGTLLVEAAWLMADVAPGLLRTQWGFTAWRGHDAATWQQVQDDAQRRRSAGLSALSTRFVGFDADPRAVRAAQANAAAAGVAALLHVEKQPLAQLQRTGRLAADDGLVLTNPPYGERLSEVDVAPFLYRCLGRKLRAVTPGWRAVVLAAQVEHLDEFRVAEHEQHRCHNGPLACFARCFQVPVQAEPRWPAFRLREGGQVPDAGQHLANRLQKNWKQLQPWVEAEGLRAFRLYDADLPEYNVAVDIYGDRIHVQEYAAPSSVDPAKAAQRLEIALDTISAVTGKPRRSLAVKVRARQKGTRQYDRRGDAGDLFEVEEYGARLLVNLTDYLDTGLFLDHRPLRRRLQSLCAGKHFLNLFCYTGSATVHAALGGARSTTSVDLNPRYLAWAEANLALNGFSTEQHHLERADVAAALGKGGDQFDVIFMDAPTFSNSKRTPNVLDIQRDHAGLVQGAMRHLAPGGVLLFSNNYRRFRLDPALPEAFDVRDITAETLPVDFQRNTKIHQCWEIRHRG